MTENIDDSAPKAAPGWYPSPTGGQRYWDGNAWLNIPAPETSTIGQSTQQTQPVNRKILIGGAALVIVVVGIIMISSNVQQENARQEEIRIQASQQAEEDAAVAREKSAAEAETTRRQGLVDDLEVYLNDNVIPDHIQKRLITGSPLGVICDPVAGGSLSDTTEETTAFQCFAQLEDNGNGSYLGRYYDVTYNWTTGHYSWDLRK